MAMRMRCNAMPCELECEKAEQERDDPGGSVRARPIFLRCEHRGYLADAPRHGELSARASRWSRSISARTPPRHRGGGARYGGTRADFRAIRVARLIRVGRSSTDITPESRYIFGDADFAQVHVSSRRCSWSSRAHSAESRRGSNATSARVKPRVDQAVAGSRHIHGGRKTNRAGGGRPRGGRSWSEFDRSWIEVDR